MTQHVICRIPAGEAQYGDHVWQYAYITWTEAHQRRRLPCGLPTILSTRRIRTDGVVGLSVDDVIEIAAAHWVAPQQAITAEERRVHEVALAAGYGES